MAIVDQTGMSEEAAKAIESNYHELYKASDDWVAAKIKQATIDGYVTVAFDLRVRTPILSQIVLYASSTPYEAQAEARTAGNALGQSYGLLNNRAAIEFQERVLASEYATRILPCAHIHDAQYFIIDNDLDVVHWVNTNLVECMEWQELPEIQHDQVKLGGALDIFYPSWKDDITIPNKSTKQEILNLCKPI